MTEKTEIKFLRGVGPKKAKILNDELHIFTYEDLLYYYPYKYIDKTKIYTLDKIHSQLPYIQAKGYITNFRTIGEGAKKRLVANFTDNTSNIELIWFKGVKWIADNYKKNVEYIIFGKPSLFQNELNIIHPEIEEANEKIKLNAALEGNYNTSEKMKKSFLTSRAIQKLQYKLISTIGDKIPETIPEKIREKNKLMSINQALKNIHFPEDTKKLQAAQYRLKFEEFFYIQLKILRKKINHEKTFSGFIFSKVGDNFLNFYNNKLPFELTNAQKRVLKEIRNNTKTGKQMNRLLQGDVGSGKTMVALMSMLLAIDNGFQACLMAPTEILATQHFHSISEMLGNMPVRIELLTGSTKKTERKKIHEGLENSEINIIIGTHALIEDKVIFNNLGLAIIDEQHRFGVAQRAKLWKKNSKPPHVLVMTATPIPRTLSMTLYGDLSLSVINELPPGRKAVKTVHLYDKDRLKVFGFMKKQIQEGRQIYIVYPLIQESEHFSYKDLEDGYQSIVRAFPPPYYSVSIVHGKMKQAEKDKAMKLFEKKQTQIMVATTVIEVGVNIPNASVMIIESAEKFGLSQLHQLRGRVGRGAKQSYCILMTSYKISADGKKRLQTMVNSNDGFEIAEVDMKLRGPGDIEGTQQSGIPMNFKIANLSKDGKILQIARNAAAEILKEDRNLENNEMIRKQMEKLWDNKNNWGKIS